MNILQILPRVPPAVCGIGDYAWRLAVTLQSNHRIHSSFLSAGTNRKGTSPNREFPISTLGTLTADALVNHVQKTANLYDAIILHVSPYGYQKRAIPFWLSRAMSRFSSQKKFPPVVVMFHELYASGPIHTSSFWFQPLQKLILKNLARTADALRTNLEAYAAWLDKVTGKKADKTMVMPVFSNFGELDHPTPLVERSASMVAFSSGIHGGGDPMSAIQNAVVLCRKFGLDTLRLIGGPKPLSAVVDGVHIDHQSFLPSEEASAFLGACRMAYTGYNPQFLGKSTILASFAAHGLAVVTRGQQSRLPDGLIEDNEVLHEQRLLLESVPSLGELQYIADKLHYWYSGHTLAKNAESYAQIIQKLVRTKQKEKIR